jgi:hypothetical protein
VIFVYVVYVVHVPFTWRLGAVYVV